MRCCCAPQLLQLTVADDIDTVDQQVVSCEYGLVIGDFLMYTELFLSRIMLTVRCVDLFLTNHILELVLVGLMTSHRLPGMVRQVMY